MRALGCRSFLIVVGLVLWSGLGDIASTRGEVGPVPQWIRREDTRKRSSRPQTQNFDGAVTRPQPNQKLPYLEKSFLLKTALKSATLEVLADDDAVVWFDDQKLAAIVPPTTSRWERVDVTSQLSTLGSHVLRISTWAPVCARLTLIDQAGHRQIIVTDPTWLEFYNGGGFGPPKAIPKPVGSLGLVGIQPWGDPLGEEVDYNQWKKSINTGKAEDSATVQVIPGFEVELVRSSQPGESSWISLTFDPQGRVIIGREGRDKKYGLLRLTLPKQAGGEVQAESLEDTLLEPRGLEFYGNDLFVNANNAHSLVRLRDTNNDGRFDEQTVLKKTPGGVGHGRNNLAFGPDGKLYSIHGNDVKLPEDFDVKRDMRVPFVALDRLRPCDWDGFLFDRNATLPAGHLVRTDIDGSRWEVVAAGFRNPYGIAFNEDGEAFTFDADNEGDLGAPWYRPTRINHIVEGGDYGWRQGTAMRPDWYPDSMPSTLVIGKSSPTGIKFGTKSHFPTRYRQSLFILDWSYGRIYAVQLLPQGSSYVGTAEVFVEGRPLNVTDLTFGPDGSMYFTTGGRGTQSGLYRVRYVGPDSVITSPDAIPKTRPVDHAALRLKRRQLERLQPTEGDLPALIQDTNHSDAWIAQAAATALMRVDVDVLTARKKDNKLKYAGCSGDECPTYVTLLSEPVREIPNSNPLPPATPSPVNPKGLTPLPPFGTITTNAQRQQPGHFRAFLSMARILPPAEQSQLLTLICNAWESQTAVQPQQGYALSWQSRLIALRAIQLCLLRVSELSPDLRRRVLAIAESPTNGDVFEVELLAFQILAHLDAAPVAQAVHRVKVADRRHDQERALVWLFELRNIKTGWTPETRKTYLEELRRIGSLAVGGRELPVVLYSIGAEFKATLNDQEREQFADLLTTPAPHAEGSLVPQRPLVKEWTVDELVPSLSNIEVSRERLERGKKIFNDANCVKCHRFAGTGQPIGPDLNGVSGRMGRKDLLETILVPSKVIDDKYKDTTLELKDGRIITGRMIGGDATRVLISPNPLAPLATVPVLRSDVDAQKVSTVSPMPIGLLNSFHTADILSLIAYIESNGM